MQMTLKMWPKNKVFVFSKSNHLTSQTPAWEKKNKPRLRMFVSYSVPLGQFLWIFHFCRNKQKPWVQIA